MGHESEIAIEIDDSERLARALSDERAGRQRAQSALESLEDSLAAEQDARRMHEQRAARLGVEVVLVREECEALLREVERLRASEFAMASRAGRFEHALKGAHERLVRAVGVAAKLALELERSQEEIARLNAELPVRVSRTIGSTRDRLLPPHTLRRSLYNAAVASITARLRRA